MEKNVKFRNHFFMVIEGFLGYWWIILWVIYMAITEEEIEDKLYTAGILAAIMAVVMIFNLIKWRKTTYIFNENAFIVEKDTLFSKKNTIAMTNISTVNINRSIFQGMFGVRKVKIDTNSAASMDSEISIYLNKQDAISLQKAIMDIIEGKMEASNEEEKKDTRKASIEEILLHCVFSLKVIQAVIAAISIGGFILSGAELEGDESAGGVMGIISVVIFIVGIFISFMKSFLVYYKLSAVRTGNELSISYGFFDYKTFKIPVNKIVAVKIVEPLIGRIFKKAYAEVVCVGMGDEEKELSLLSLCTSKKLLAAKLHMLLPEFIPEEVNNVKEFYTMKKESKKAILVRIGKSLFVIGCLIIGVVIGVNLAGESDAGFNMVVAFSTLIIGAIILLYDLSKNFNYGYSLDNKYLRIATGAFSKTIYIVPYKNIEFVTIKKSPVYKMFGLATSLISTKSGSIVSFMIIETGYIEDKDIDIILNNFNQSFSRVAALK